jgi:hypothetical protein
MKKAEPSRKRFLYRERAYPAGAAIRIVRAEAPKATMALFFIPTMNRGQSSNTSTKFRVVGRKIKDGGNRKISLGVLNVDIKRKKTGKAAQKRKSTTPKGLSIL